MDLCAIRQAAPQTRAGGFFIFRASRPGGFILRPIRSPVRILPNGRADVRSRRPGGRKRVEPSPLHNW